MNNQNFDNANRGALFGRQKRTTNSPDMSGDITIGGDLLDYIAQALSRGEREVKIDIAAWRRMGRNNSTFMSLKVQPYREREQQGGYQGGQQSGYGNQRPQQRQQGAYGDRYSQGGNQRPQQQRGQQQNMDYGQPVRDLPDDDIPF